MKVQLLTGKKRELVARYSIPEFNPGPEVLMWGSRHFIRADEQLIDVLDHTGKMDPKVRVTNYVEGVCYFVSSTNPTWEIWPEGEANG